MRYLNLYVYFYINMRPVVCFFIVVLVISGVRAPIHAQTPSDIKWFDPAANSYPVVQGRGWQEGLAGPYDRLPSRAQPLVRTPLWNLSKNAAGLSVRFKTSANGITVRYKVAGPQSMPHMPATGVSGVDLYARDVHGNLRWARGGFSFGDTIVYRFNNVSLSAKEEEFILYLPLYNTVTWMEIGVTATASFQFAPVPKEKPIVVYGTSILQGACASRPGLAWTNILERKVDRPIINLGFSGNGQLEAPLIDLMNEIDARLYVLDCMPNLVDFVKFPPEEIRKRLRYAVNSLQEKHPATPVLLVEHSCGTAGVDQDTALFRRYKASSDFIAAEFAIMQQEGIKNIFLLTDEAIGFDGESTVDGTHPNDIGMMKYAEAYEQVIRKIFQEEKGTLVTTQPVRQRRDHATYDFISRHEAVLETIKETAPRLLMIGNSITHFWGGKPESGINRGIDSWNRIWQPKGAVNMGFGWDRIENVLWRVHHGELDGYKAEKIILNIGTNNLSVNNTDEEIVAGLKHLLRAIQQRQPQATIYISGLYPRRKMEDRIQTLNRAIAQLGSGSRIIYADPGKVLLGADGKIRESLFSDGLHPNANGYELLGEAWQTYLK